MPRTFGRSLLRGTFLVLAVAALPAAVLTFRDLALTVSDEELIAAAGGVAGYIVFALFSRNLAQGTSTFTNCPTCSPLSAVWPGSTSFTFPGRRVAM